MYILVDVPRYEAHRSGIMRPINSIDGLISPSYESYIPDGSHKVKVKDLIYKLNQLDQNLEVYCYEEGPVLIQGVTPGPFELVDVSPAPVLSSRDGSTNKVSFKFEGNVPGARNVAIIGITADF
jgi:hypothetical protein